ncbi:head closure Hc1 [Enterobacter phage Ec_L1]|uniref:Uncharacterized protein n=1 Tax=Enterobacter phage Ec_L1 TaxID=2070180 RepID=A0A2P0W9Y6_9CAUD|nr:head closure Hc1 [Enterobacter phage Ec_L1]AUV57181.1 hypothetical protein Ec67 [Enterobacter phage Ec_L1]
MNYKHIQKMATAGINRFSDDNGWFDIIISGGGKKVIGGKEVVIPEERSVIKGAVRDVNDRDVNGDSIRAGDKRGFFTCDQEIKQGMRIIIDGEAYTVVNARPIKPTGTVVAYRPILRRVAVANG